MARLIREDRLERREKTCWLHPIELSRTAFRALFATEVAGYTDRRELLARIVKRKVEVPENCRVKPTPRVKRFDAIVHPQPEDDGVWIDFVADVGDGFDATYATASLLARPKLRIRGLAEELPRADILVL